MGRDGETTRSTHLMVLFVSRYEAEDLATMLELDMFTTSAKDDVNIELVFQHLANSYFNTLAAQSAPARHYSPRYCSQGT